MVGGKRRSCGARVLIVARAAPAGRGLTYRLDALPVGVGVGLGMGVAVGVGV